VCCVLRFGLFALNYASDNPLRLFKIKAHPFGFGFGL